MGFAGAFDFSRLWAVFAVATALALVPSAEAQWFPPFGAVPPAEIVNRLRAEGYVLARPLERRDTVYLADVVRGPHGRERLVVDAWSGEILQRFLARRGGFAPEGGEFSEPPPLGPPPARDFREGDFGYGPPGGFGAPPPRVKARQRPAATARKGGEPKLAPPSEQPAEPQNAGPGSPGTAPAAAVPVSPPAAAAVNPTASEPAMPEASPPNAASAPNPAAEPAKAAQPKAEAAPPPAPAEAKEAARPSTPAPATDKREKKVNDVPVNPLE